MFKQFPISPDTYEAIHTNLSTTNLDDEEVLRVTKKDKIMEFDENTIVKLKDCDFHNGTIRVKMLSRLLPDAPDFARGFIGIVFRVKEDNSEFESFYIRPTNAMTDDPVRRAHGCQYFSYPGYTFAYFREFGITEYEAPMNYGLDEWVLLTAVIKDDHADFYLSPIKADKAEKQEKQDNQANQNIDYCTPILSVDGLKHGKDSHGSVGFFSEIGTEAFFKDLEIEFDEI